MNVDIVERTYKLALQIVKLVRTLPKETAGIELGKQLIRSGTSIAANVEEAQGGFSKKDFTYKMNIALKEARETHLWLRLIKDSELLASSLKQKSLIQESLEIKNILGAIVKKSRGKLFSLNF